MFKSVVCLRVNGSADASHPSDIASLARLENLKTLCPKLAYAPSDFKILARASEATRDILLLLILACSVLDLDHVTVTIYRDRAPAEHRFLSSEVQRTLADQVQKRLLDKNGVAQHNRRMKLNSILRKRLEKVQEDGENLFPEGINLQGLRSDPGGDDLWKARLKRLQDEIQEIKDIEAQE